MSFVYFDLDGVMRNLGRHVLGRAPQTWDDTLPDGQPLMDYINANLHVLEDAPPTKLLPIILKVPKLCILTVQPEAWKPYTQRWLRKHIGGEARYHIMYFDSPDAKLDFVMSRKNEKVRLVEDYPFFADYSKVWLVEWPYNKEAKAGTRIKAPNDLVVLLQRERIL